MKSASELPKALFLNSPAERNRWSRADRGAAVLRRVCRALNTKSDLELRARLRTWVAAWQRSGPNLERLTRELPELESQALAVPMYAEWEPANGSQPDLLLFPDYPALERLLGSRRVWRTSDIGNPIPTAEVRALMLFQMLTVVPACGKIAGPCPTCDRYFIKGRTSQTVYCSRICNKVNSTRVWNMTNYQRKRDDKLRRARAAAQDWRAARTAEGWRVFVCKREPDLTTEFLSRAVNRGDLRDPSRK